MIGLFFISLMCAIFGTVVAVAFDVYRHSIGALVSLIAGFVLTLFGWTICWMYDSPHEFLARLKYDNVRTLYITEDSVEKFNIDLKNPNIVYANTMNMCKEHGDNSFNCGARCEYVKALYVMIREAEDNKAQYEMPVEKERK